MSKRLVLASASPRRREILSTAGYDFEIVTSNADEISDGSSAAEVARINALAKAREVLLRGTDECVVVGADTVVACDGSILGKPRDESDAFAMIKSLSGKKHSVITGYAVVSKDGEESGYCSTEVEFRTLSDGEIRDYVATGEPMDKAGAYGIQERASIFVSSLEGDFFNVVGLPVAKLYKPLKKFGILPKWQKDVE